MRMMAWGPVAAVALPAWTLLLSTEEGAAPFDPSALAGVGTGFDATTGVFTWVMPAGDVTQVDGFQEPQIRWTKRVLDLYPDFDLLTDILDLAMVIDAMPLSATVEKFGASVGLFDRGTADIPNLKGLGFAVYPNTAAAWVNGNMAAGSIGSPNTCTGTPEAALCRFDAGADAGELAGRYRVRNTLGALEEGNSPATAPPVVVGDLTIHIGHIHRSIVGTAGATVQVRVYHRRIRTTGLTGLP